MRKGDHLEMVTLFLLMAYGLLLKASISHRMVLSLSKGPSIKVRLSGWLYILRLKSGAYYIGATTDLDQRYKDHGSGKATRTTKLDPPAELIYSEKFETFVEARCRESQIKKWSRAKKEALVAGDFEKLRLLAKSRQK
jgi:putative endonuclease